MATNTAALPFLVRFYDPTIHAADRRGRTLTSILEWPDDRLEHTHDYIQILFPLPERSPINPSAPIINEETFYLFRDSARLHESLREAFGRMLKFYGFVLSPQQTLSDMVEDRCTITLGANFAQASRNWVTRFNHNHLRITRIIRSCRVLALEHEAVAFHEALLKVAEQQPGVISQKSLMFWERAAERPLYLAPEDDEDKGQGKDFLYMHEQKPEGPSSTQAATYGSELAE